MRELLVQLQPRTSLKTDGSRALPSAWTSPCVASFFQGSPRTLNPNIRLMLVLPRRRTFRPPLALSPTTTVCDEARSWPPNVTDDDQAHVNPHPVAHLIVPHVPFRCVTVVCSGRCGNPAAALKSALYTRCSHGPPWSQHRVVSHSLVRAGHQVSFPDSVAPHSATACLSKSCFSHNRRLTQPAVPQSFCH